MDSTKKLAVFIFRRTRNLPEELNAINTQILCLVRRSLTVSLVNSAEPIWNHREFPHHFQQFSRKAPPLFFSQHEPRFPLCNYLVSPSIGFRSRILARGPAGGACCHLMVQHLVFFRTSRKYFGRTFQNILRRNNVDLMMI